MSYCRFSSDDFRSDVYVYQGDGYWAVHVASSRLRFTAPIPAPVDIADIEGWLERHRIVAQMCKEAATEPIGLPQDGASFYLDSPGEAADRLQELAEAGYHVPDGVVTVLLEEQAELVNG